MILITGGCSTTKPALDDCYLLDTELWSFQKVHPLGRFLSEEHFNECCISNYSWMLYYPWEFIRTVLLSTVVQS